MQNQIAQFRHMIRSLRLLLEMARLPHQSRLAYIPALLALLRGRLFADTHITLETAIRYRYRFRYLNNGLVALARQGRIAYRYRINDDLGRKTAVIRLQQGKSAPKLAVIDATDRTWSLGNPHLDLESIFGDQPRVLFKLEYSLQHIHDRMSYDRLFIEYDTPSPPIGSLYDTVLDGAYWPLNKHFLDARWVQQQRKRTPTGDYDLVAHYGLDLGDLNPDRQPNPDCERIWFLRHIRQLQQEYGMRIDASSFRHNPEYVMLGDYAQELQPFVNEEGLPFDVYLDRLFQAKLLFVPKNGWHKPDDTGDGERTYRLMENLILGLACLSSRTSLHCPFEPGVHYISFSKDLSDFIETVRATLADPDQIEAVRQNTRDLYDAYLSPAAVARHYIDTLLALE